MNNLINKLEKNIFGKGILLIFFIILTLIILGIFSFFFAMYSYITIGLAHLLFEFLGLRYVIDLIGITDGYLMLKTFLTNGPIFTWKFVFSYLIVLLHPFLILGLIIYVFTGSTKKKIP